MRCAPYTPRRTPGLPGRLFPTGAEPGALRASLLPSATFVDAHEWDALVRDNDFFHTQGWLASLDDALGDAELLTVRGPGGVVAGCGLWSGEREPGLFCLASFFPLLPGPWTRDFLWLGARRSTHNELPCVEGPRRAVALARLRQEAVALATQRGLAGVIVPYMPVPAALEFVAGSRDAMILLHSAEASIQIPAGGLRDLIHRFNAHDRNQMKAELAAFVRKGNRVEWTRIDEAMEAVAARLITQNRARHGSSQGEEWMRGLLAGQRKSGVLQSAVAAVSKRDERITGMTVFYPLGKSLHARYFGSDYSVPSDDFRYFVLTYYEALDHAAAHGLKQLRLSTSALRAKVKRGAQLEPLAAVVIPSPGEAIEPAAGLRHNGALLDEFHEQFTGHLSPDWERVPR